MNVSQVLNNSNSGRTILVVLVLIVQKRLQRKISFFRVDFRFIMYLPTVNAMCLNFLALSFMRNIYNIYNIQYI